MAQDIRLGVEVTDSGSAKKTEKAIDDLNKKLAESKKLTKDVQAELKAIGEANTKAGTEGSRRASTIQEYGTQRGVAALTGAAGRDFANQAQGLDGLVRLYATYAANVFALGAAFRALSVSIDTDNMIKGLDQLGAAVGRNLGSLSKKFAELSGGAVSLREAMQAVAQTTSGGMSTKNIERLAKVASSASMALGVAMPDAVNRLSRGITKLEPELLDELGIMTRLEPATQAYARELGKANSQLTDFERRQAFANAVLLEGETKFGAISDLVANPYDKLLASLKNVLQVGASALNTVLGPIADLLASSPSALAAGIAGLAALVLKTALPAVGQFKQQLAAAAESSAIVAKDRADDAIKANQRAQESILQQVNSAAIREIEINDAAQKRIEELRGKSLKKSSLAYKVLNEAAADVTSAEIKGLETLAKRMDSKGRTEEAAAYRDVAAAITEQRKAADALEKSRLAHIARFEKAEGSKTSVAGITQALAIEAQNAATKKAIISNAAYNASLIGIKDTYIILNAEIAKSGLVLSSWEKLVLKAQASVAILSGVVSTLASGLTKLTNAFAYIAIIVTLFTTLDSMLSTNAKESEEFSKALDEVESSSKNLHRTLDGLTRQMSFATIAGINAMAQAMDNLNSSIVSLVTTADKNKKAMTGIWSIAFDEVSKLWGGDVESKLAKGLSQSILDVLELVENSGLKEEARAGFKRILGIDSLDTSSVKKAVEDLSKSGQKSIVEFNTKLTSELNNSGSRLQAFKVSTDASTRAYQQFIQSTSNISPLFRVGVALQNVGVEMFKIAQVSKGTTIEIDAVMTELAAVPESGAAFGSEFISQLIGVREEFVLQGKSIQTYKKLILDLERQMNRSKLALPTNYDFQKDTNQIAETGTKDQVNAIKILRKLELERKAIEEGIILLESNQSEKSRKLFTLAMDSAFNKGTELIRVSLGQALERGALAIGKASLLGLTGANRAEAENALAKQEIDIQLKAIQSSVDLVISQELLRASIDESTATNALLIAHQTGKSPAEIKVLEDAKEAATILTHILSSSNVPNLANATSMTGDSNVALQVRARGTGIAQKLAELNETKILLDAQVKAQGISGGINIQKGALEDEQKKLNLQNQLTASTQARAAAVGQIVTIASEEVVLQQVQLEKAALINKQSSELAAINTDIAIATSRKEKDKQEGFKLLVEERHEQELNVQALTGAQRLLVARVETLSRIFELTKATNQADFAAGYNQVEIINAETQAYTELYGIVETYSASQTFIASTQKVQLDYIKAISDATLDLAQKQEKAGREVAALDPTKDASKIKLITDELTRQETITKATITTAKGNLDTQTRILKVTKEAKLEQSRYNRILANSASIGSIMSEAFGEVGTAIGDMVEAFGRLTVNAEKGTKAIIKLQKEQAVMVPQSEEYLEKQRDIDLQNTKNVQNELAGYISTAGAAKNMFDEKSAAHNAFAALEQALAVAHIAISVAQMVQDGVATAKHLANVGTRIGADVAEAEVAGTKGIIKTLADLPPPLNFIAAGAMAAVIGALLSSIGGSSSGASMPSIPGGTSAADMQSSQGTGRKYKNGKLVDTDFGALGSSTEQVRDISNSISLIEEHTSLTSTFGQDTLVTLKLIETNTKELAAAVFRTTSVGKLSSGFGTREFEQVASGGLLSGIFGGSTKSVSIIDKGIKVIGQFNDILKGTAEYLEFETIQGTKTKSSLFGGSKTKITIINKAKDLTDESQEVIVSLFSSLADASITAGKEIFGTAQTSIENILSDFLVEFKVSGMGLSGEEFADAILAESTVVMNEIIAKAMPQLDQFRELGEGFSGTLIRLATTIGVVDETILKLGANVPEVIDGLINLDFYNSLVKQFGGLEDFSSKTDYFFENFYSESEQFNAKSDAVTGALKNFTEAGILTQAQFEMLTDSIGNTREEYRSLIFAQDYSTKAGRAAADALFEFAPAIVEVTDEYVSSIEKITKPISELIDEVGLGVSTFTEVLNDAILGKLNSEDIGSNIATVIEEGFYLAMSNSFVENISMAIVNDLITPILQGALNLSSAGSLAISGMINQGVEAAIAQADALVLILDNPAFKTAMTTISTAISQVVTKVNNNAKTLQVAFSNTKVNEYLQELADLNNELESKHISELIEVEQTRLDLLEEQATILEESAASLRSFSKDLTDFKQSLLVGSLSPLTPLEQYSTIKTQLDNLVITATTSTNMDEQSAALAKIQEISTSFLDISRVVYSSGAQYTNDFNYVQAILDDLINTTSAQATIYEQQLAALNTQIDISKATLASLEAQQDALNNIDNSTASILERIVELNELLAEQYVSGATDIAQGFSTLDTNLDNVLTISELKASGMASDETLNHLVTTLDTNNDGQISRLESLLGASEGTYYTLQSITPILEAINAGIISLATGESLIAGINGANINAGGSPISGTYNPSGGTGVGYTGTSTTYNSSLGGYISNGVIYGVAGQEISLSEGSAAILNIADAVNAGTQEARSLYDVLIGWGVNSSMTAQIIGSTQQDVLNWFKFHDPSIPAFARGINQVPEDMLGYLHKDERVLPAADNRELMQTLSNKTDIDKQLLEEIKMLNARVRGLEKAIVDGAIINATATDRNTIEISSTIKNTGSVSIHNDNIRRKVAIS